MKKLLSILLLATVILSVFAACGGNGNETASTTTPTTNGSDATTTPAETDPVTTGDDTHDLPADLRFDGKEFFIGCERDGNVSQYWANYFDVDEPEPANMVQEAAYSRNLEIEEQLGITITAMTDWSWGEGLNKALDVCSRAGKALYDMMALEPIFSYEALIIDELVMDVTAMPYMDLSKSYYNHRANETYYLRDNLYFFTSDITFPCQGAVHWMVNDDMMIDLGYAPDYLFEKVENYEWTVAVLEDMIEGTYVDVNYDGEKDLNDIYGVGGMTGAFCNLYPGAGLKGTFYTEDGFEFDYGSDFSLTVYNKILELKTGPDVFCIDWVGDPWLTGNALFTSFGSEIQQVRSMEFEFSLVPVPMFNDQQDTYYNFACGGVTIIPCTIEDENFVGAVIEAMASGSAKHLVPAFYDNFVEQGVLRNQESCDNWDRMLNEWALYEFTYLISPDNRLRYYAPVYELLYVNDPDFTSYWEAQEESIAESCWIFYEFYLSDVGA